MRPCIAGPGAGFRRAAIGTLLACAALVGWLRPAQASDPELVAVGSFLLPGVGQAVNGDYAVGAFQAGLYFHLANRYVYLIERDDYIKPEDRDDSETHTYRINDTSFEADLYGTALLDLQFYSAFGAYRDARNQPQNLLDYSTPPPQESFTDLALAPFRWEFLSRPGTWLPLVLPLYVALTPAADDQWVYAPDDTITRREMRRWFFVQHEMVAVGEEAFFRGVLNNGLSDQFGPGWGLVASSVAFGVGHTGNAGAATPAIATLYGLYLGWLQQRNDYAIGQGVAIHYWWNTLTSYILTKQRGTGQISLLNLYLRF